MLLQVLVERSESAFVAHCLDFDIATSGKSVEDTISNIKDAISCYVVACNQLGIEGTDMLRPAPQEYWDTARKAWVDPNTEISMIRLDINDIIPGSKEEACVAV